VGEPRPAAHERRGAPTRLGAIAVQADALGHFGHVPLAQTGVRSVLALLGTLDTSSNAALEFVVRHGIDPIHITGTSEGKYVPVWPRNRHARGSNSIPSGDPLYLPEIGKLA
jgi:hypothetical protein